jgi:hypothetical protein
MGAALAWSYWESLVLGKGYPEAYIMGPPEIRFNDFANSNLASTLPNPYDDPNSYYPPPAYVFLRTLAYSDTFSLICIYFFSLTSFAFLLTQLLQPITTGAWARVSLAFLFLALSYPLIFCIDRGNIEIIQAPLIAWTIYFYSRHREVEGTACLFPAICLKLFPAILLVLLLRRRKVGLAILCGVGVIALTAACCGFFPAPPSVIWNVVLEKTGVISPVNFDFDGPLILASYRIYSFIFALIAVVCAGYAWLCEHQEARSMVMLLLLISIAAPGGGDYRLMYAEMALLLLVLLPRQRPGDWTALVLIALAVIPMKEILLTFAGKTETGYADIPIQSFLSPIFILVAMSILLYQSRHMLVWQRAAQRLTDLHPSRWRWI